MHSPPLAAAAGARATLLPIKGRRTITRDDG